MVVIIFMDSISLYILGHLTCNTYAHVLYLPRTLMVKLSLVSPLL